MRRPTTLLPTLLSTLLAALTALTALQVVAPAHAEAPWRDSRSTFEGTAGPRVTPRVVDLRYASHPGFDRVVMEIRGAIPSGNAVYKRRFRHEGSGDPVPIGGRAGLQLNLRASGHDRQGHDVYDGPDVARPRLDTLKALAVTGDFEGYLSLGFALTHRADYRVFWLHSPQRLVIDFRHE